MQPLLNKRQVAELLGVNPNTVDRMRAAGTFPQPLRFPGSSAVRWRPEHPDQWLAEQIQDPLPADGRGDQIVNALNPFAKTAGETATGVSTFTRAPFVEEEAPGWAGSSRA